MSQQQLAKLAGTTQATVSSVESGTGNYTLKTLNDLARVFGGEVKIMLVNRPASRRQRK